MTDARERLRNWEYQNRARDRAARRGERSPTAPAGAGGEGLHPNSPLPALSPEAEE